MTRTGGPCASTREGFGDFAGFPIAWGDWIALRTGNGAVAVALAGYAGYLLPAVAASPPLSLAVSLGAI